MARESEIQTKLIKFLKKKGCYVIKTKPGPGVPVGCPDVFFFLEGFWGSAECKASRTSRYQPLQKDTIAKLDDWSFSRAVYPENFDEVIDELDTLL